MTHAMIPGTQMGAYRITTRIGEGGMGAVWLAEHVMLGRRAAIKVLHPQFSSQPEIVTRFFNEARAATAISDPGIVQIYDFGQHVDGSAYIVMEFLEGETLHDRLERYARLSPSDALRLILQVSTSLGEAHARGIVHRDLKPENIFIVRDAAIPGGERAKILDFGIAKLIGDGSMKTSTSAVMGTPMFMSPEQCRGAGRVDQRSDVYALGCVLFTLITGNPPFNGEGIGDIIAMHIREPATPPSHRVAGVPPDVDALVLRCLAKAPADRFASGRELAAAIEQLLHGTSASHSRATMMAAHSASSIGPRTTMSLAAGAVSSTVPPPPRTSSKVIPIMALATIAVAGGLWFGVVRSRAVVAPSEPPPRSVAITPAPAVPAPSAPDATITVVDAAVAPAGVGLPAAAASKPVPIPQPVRAPAPPRSSATSGARTKTRMQVANPGPSSGVADVEFEEPASPDVPPTKSVRETPPPLSPATTTDAGAKLDRASISRAMVLVKPRVRACGSLFRGTRVVVSVSVAADGAVSNVTVTESPDAWLTSCVTARIKVAKFPMTSEGGSFRQSFEF